MSTRNINNKSPAYLLIRMFFIFSILSGILTGEMLSAQESASLPLKSLDRDPMIYTGLPRPYRTMGMPHDSTSLSINLDPVYFGTRRIEVYVDKDWETITLTEYINNMVVRMPLTAPVDWYIRQTMNAVSRNQLLFELIPGKKRSERSDIRGSQRTLEVVGVDLGQLGRASIRVSGNVNISGKMVFQDQELVRSSINQTNNTHLEFKQKQNLRVEGKVGDRVTVYLDEDSERDFDWENNIRVSYDGKEDDIIQKVEAGNISLSLPATQFVTFSGQNKGLFGFKALSKIGPLNLTSIASIEQTKKERQKYTGGSESQTQKINDYDYVKNQYFFIHEWYRNGASGTGYVIPPFYPLVDGLHLIGNVKLRNFELYKMDLTNDPSADIGTAYVDPETKSPEHKAYDRDGNFIRLERNVDYTISEDLGYIRLTNRTQNEVLGCNFTLTVATGDTFRVIKKVGHGIRNEGDSLELKLLTTESPHPNDPTWDLMFKNVYALGNKNINREGFDIRIVNDRLRIPSDRSATGIPYITLFGLDSLNENGIRVSDEVIDLNNPNIINLVTGELYFPAYHPFVSSDSIFGGNANPDLQQSLGEGLMYKSTQRTTIMGDRVFTIEVDMKNKSSTINLGFMLVEGSEEVLLNGIQLTRGVDYQIDYFTGTILLEESASDPNANLEILFDKHELISFDKKVILGTRAQMDLGDRSFIGATALYYNQSVINQKVEVGYEPTRNFIWDLNGRYQFEMPWLTNTLDRLPVIETEKNSSFSIEGEIAQVRPNPNYKNQAFIDDFEGSKRTSTLPIQRRAWKESSSPLIGGGAEFLKQGLRARTHWYNPYGQVLTRSIWPNQSVSSRAQNETTDILSFKMIKRDSQKEIDPDSVWAGITTTMYSGDFDQTQSKFFEVWLRSAEDEIPGKLTIDLGKISEDRNGNGIMDTEDTPEAGLTLGNGFLEDAEDVGIDGCTDEYEDGFGGCLTDGATYAEHLASGNTTQINTGSEVDPNDPNGDNWYYKEGSSDYSHVNGTEGNGTGEFSGGRIQEGGKYPDTEDMDRSGFLDKTNAYYTTTINLSDLDYIVTETEDNEGIQTGWKLYQIPLIQFEAVNAIEWNEIKYARLVWSGVETDSAKMYIAKMEIVGNDWLEEGISKSGKDEYRRGRIDFETGSGETDSIFSITVVNTDENPEYVPPEGVIREYDEINEIERKEQSLVLNVSELPGGYKAAAKKILFSLKKDQANSYLTYDYLKMFYMGKEKDPLIPAWSLPGNEKPQLFLRFGIGEDYYEVIETVDTVNAWKSLSVDLDWLTSLKNHYSDSTTTLLGNEDKLKVSTDDKGNTVRQYSFISDGDTIKKVIIHGAPALNRIQFFQTGIINTSDKLLSGSFLINELRLSGVKRAKEDRGVAMRLQSQFEAGDILRTSVLYSRTDADFHVLQKRLGSNNTSENIRVNSSLQLHKFLPVGLGLNIPLNASFSNTVGWPKYMPGSDIRVDKENIPDDIMSRSQSATLGTNVSKPGKSDNPIIKYTLDNLSGSFNSSVSRSSNEIMESVKTETYSGKISYDHRFGRDNYIKPMSWASSIPVLGNKLKDISLYYAPERFNFSTSINEKLTEKQTRAGNKSPADYNLSMKNNWGMNYKLTESFSTQYSRSANSDLDYYRGYLLYTFRDPDSIQVTNVQENLSASFTPTLTKWLKPNFNYSAGYNWAKPLGSSIPGANIGSQLRFNANINFVPSAMFESITSKSSTTGSRGTARRTRSRSRQTEDVELEKKTRSRRFVSATNKVLKKIDPISLIYSQTLGRSARAVLLDTLTPGYSEPGHVPIGYRFGWLPDHGMYHSDRVGTNTGAWDYRRDMTMRSGLKPINNLSVTWNYNQNISSTISSTGLERWTLTRDYLLTGDELDINTNGLPFPGWSVRISGVEKWPLIRRLFRTASIDHSYSGKLTKIWQFEETSPERINIFNVQSFIDNYREDERSTKLTMSYSPLFGMSTSFKNGISMTFRHNFMKTVDEEPTGTTIKTDRTYNASANYAYKKGLTIPLPFWDDIKVQNTINFTLNFDMNESETRGTKNKTELSTLAFLSGWKTGLRISYTFSNRITGGIIYEYRERDSKTTGRKIDRDFGFDVNIAISG